MFSSHPKIVNVYAVCVLATIGGLLQGFDVSSLSAILATPQVIVQLHTTGEAE
jgi:hypothetical protein